MGASNNPANITLQKQQPPLKINLGCSKNPGLTLPPKNRFKKDTYIYIYMYMYINIYIYVGVCTHPGSGIHAASWRDGASRAFSRPPLQRRHVHRLRAPGALRTERPCHGGQELGGLFALSAVLTDLRERTRKTRKRVW